jgi:cystathionine beta-lyase/cystathionine gamma-synthase
MALPTDLVFTRFERDGNYYSRTYGKEVVELIELLKKRYSAQDADIFCSGMSAISTVLHALLQRKPNSVILYSSELYCDTTRLIKKLPEIYRQCQVKVFDILHQPESIATNKPTILFVESASNPNSILFNFNLLKPHPNLTVVVDNTWLTSVHCNPLEKGADVVVNSLSKYYSGGSAIAGAVINNRQDIMDDINVWKRFNGIHNSPYDTQVIINSLKTMDHRIAVSSALTKEVVSMLPKLDIKYLEGCSVFTFRVKTSKSRALKFLRQSKIIFKTSFGGHETRIDPFPKRDGDYVICRVACGYGGEMTAKEVADEVLDLVEKMIRP